MTFRQAKNIGIIGMVLALCGCAAKHGPATQVVFRIEARQGGLHLIPPSLPGGTIASPIPFSQILTAQYSFNPWEQYVDLREGMRLAVQRLTGETTTSNSYYGIVPAGRRGLRLRSITPEPEAVDRRAKHLRLFYQTKFTKSPGQPLRPALFLWSESSEQLVARTAEARENPSFACNHECLAFPGKTTVTPEVQIIVNQKARYVVLGSTVREVLRSDRVRDDVVLRLMRKYRNHLVPVTWQEKAYVLNFPLVAGDEISWQ